LITGSRPFIGDSRARLTASILKEEPQPLHKLQPQAPPGIVRVLQICLEKDPEKRWQSAREVRHALKWAADMPFEAPLPETVVPTDDLSLSPDGRKLVFSAVGDGGLWIRDFDSLAWRGLPGTEGAASPFWSPDNRYLAFAVGDQLRKAEFTARPGTLCTVPGNPAGSGAWNQDGVIIFGSWGGGSGGPLWKVSALGGAPTALTQ